MPNLISFEIQESYRKAIDFGDVDKIKTLMQTGVMPNYDNMLVMRKAVQAKPFYQGTKEDPLWQVYLTLLEKTHQT